MARKKQQKLDEIKILPNTFSSMQENVLKLIKDYFGNGKNYTLELACGNGDYIQSLSEKYPERNFIGVDRKGNRIWTGAKNLLKADSKNTAFLISSVERIDSIFEENSIEEIWITFPDPYPRRNSMHKRLVYPRFLEVYKKILLPGAKINLKTDDDTLYNYAVQIVEENGFILHKMTDNLYNGSEFGFEESIQTKYEKNHIKEGKKIKYICFSIS
jgi:tRNA (guanine-N7-)-methyltransferase